MKQPTPWIIALLISVLINGALIGFVLHRSADGPSWRSPAQSDEPGEVRRAGPGQGGFNVRGFVRALPEDYREQARERLRESRPQARELMQQARQARLDAEAVLSREPFDAVAVRAAMDNMHARRRISETLVENLVLELVADLEPAERDAAMAAGRRGRGGPPGGRRRGPPPHERDDR